VRVEFGSCSAPELAELYRAFAALCLDTRANRALLKAGDEDPQGHCALHDVAQGMATHPGIAIDFKLALVPSTGSIAAVYREAQRTLRAAGFNAWVFASENEAMAWLEGSAPGGATAS
jgi:hypothetical protein